VWTGGRQPRACTVLYAKRETVLFSKPCALLQLSAYARAFAFAPGDPHEQRSVAKTLRVAVRKEEC